MLVNGLSGHTSEEIQAVKPEFIQFAGIANSLTPGRNNGFLNMLRLMKTKAQALSEGLSKQHGHPESSTTSTSSASPIADAITTKLSLLKPTEFVLENESHKHAGHAGMGGQVRRESHFKVKIVAACFDGLSLVQRHKMIYTLLAKEMNATEAEHIHALSIVAKTPSENT